MKKKLLSLFLATTVLLCAAGCGNDASSASVKEDNETTVASTEENAEEEKVEEESKEEATEEEIKTEVAGETTDEDLWGTKRPVSANYYNQSRGPYQMTFDYNDDGSYTGRIQWESFDYVYYYAANGIITKKEQYSYSGEYPDGKLQNIIYFNNGIAITGDTTGMGLFLASELFRELENAKPEYDKDGNIIGDIIIDKNTEGKVLVWSSVPDVIIERDDKGRITKTIEDASQGETYFLTDYLYEDNAIIMKSYHELPEEYDSINRTTGIKSFQYGIKVVLNPHGLIEEVSLIKEDNTPKGLVYSYKYDAYGFLTSITENDKDYVRIEYTYDDGTVTSSSENKAEADSTLTESSDGLVGVWYDPTGYDQVKFQLNADGTGKEIISDTSIDITWDSDENTLIIHDKWGTSIMDINGDKIKGDSTYYIREQN